MIMCPSELQNHGFGEKVHEGFFFDPSRNQAKSPDARVTASFSKAMKLCFSS